MSNLWGCQILRDEGRRTIKPEKNTGKKKKKLSVFPRSQHGGSILFHTHKSDQLKIEIHYTLDKQFQTLTKADLGMGISSNLHLVMFHIWTWNVLGEKSKLKKTAHAIALLKYWRQFDKSSEQPWNSRGGGRGWSLRQYLFSNTLPLLSTSLYVSCSSWGLCIL